MASIPRRKLFPHLPTVPIDWQDLPEEITNAELYDIFRSEARKIKGWTEYRIEQVIKANTPDQIFELFCE